MTLVVDANVAVKWYVAQVDRHKALQVQRYQGPLLAPSLSLSECTNAFWLHWRRGEMEMDQARHAVHALPSNFAELADVVALSRPALDLAFELGHSPYDCVYLALAEMRGARLITADDTFVDKLARKRRTKNIVRLSSWSP